jgi:hypothetical protein
VAEPFDSVKALGEIPRRTPGACGSSQADRSVIRSIRLGVLFVMAFWSGPAKGWRN